MEDTNDLGYYVIGQGAQVADAIRWLDTGADQLIREYVDTHAFLQVDSGVWNRVWFTTHGAAVCISDVSHEIRLLSFGG